MTELGRDSQYIGKTLRRQVGRFAPYGGTQERLALESGVQRNFISLIELGQNQPTISTIARLARSLGTKASELVTEAERETL